MPTKYKDNIYQLTNLFLNRRTAFFGTDYKVALLFKVYLTVSGIIIQILNRIDIEFLFNTILKVLKKLTSLFNPFYL